MSCIYGPHQFGTEDQGWVAHFLIRALQGEPITIYGDGRQVRDVLFVDDLVDALLLAQAHMPAIRGQAFNIGGGPGNALSLLELLDQIGEAAGCRARGRLRPMAAGRSALVRLRHRRVQRRHRLAAAHRPRRGLARLLATG